MVNTARAARAGGATRLAVVSALGAEAKSRVFYNRVKGEMQAAVAQLGYESVVIAQPSLLLGDRAALGQPARSGEMWAARLLGPLGWMVPKAVRPIPAPAVASALLAAILDAKPGVRILKSGAGRRSDRENSTLNPRPDVFGHGRRLLGVLECGSVLNTELVDWLVGRPA